MMLDKKIFKNLTDQMRAAIFVETVCKMAKQVCPDSKFMISVDDGKGLHVGTNLESPREKHKMAERVVMLAMREYQDELGIEDGKEFVNFLKKERKAQDG